MPVKKRLGEMLIEAGVIDSAQLAAALGHQRKWGGKLGQALIDLHFATEPQIVSALSQKFGYQSVDVAALQRTPEVEKALRLVPSELATRQTLLPIATDTHTLTVAMGDPSNIAVVDELSFRTGKRIKVALAGDRAIADAVRRLYFDGAEAPNAPSAIALEEAPEIELETTTDPFAAMPAHVREGYFPGSAGGAGPEPARRPSPNPPAPARAAPHPPSGSPPFAPVPGAAPREAPNRPLPPAAAAPLPTRSPPLPRAAPPAGPHPGAPPLHGQPPPPAPGEAVLATDLLAEGVPVAASPTPMQLALRDALARAARGEEGPVTRQLVAALARVLLRRGLITEDEILAELKRR